MFISSLRQHTLATSYTASNSIGNCITQYGMCRLSCIDQANSVAPLLSQCRLHFYSCM
jgi:hypothetical protein